MDHLTRAFYELNFELNFFKKKMTEFQNFFSELMEKRYPEDFIRVRPWGRVGDRKNDGYLRSKRILFQVYAPKEMTAREAISKIEEDFNGALPYWEKYFDKWIFVHNERGGLGPNVSKKLLDLDTEYDQITVTSWGFEELRQELFQLSEENIASLLGHAPTADHILQIQLKDLEPVLLHLARQPAISQPEIKPVPKDKLEANALSENVEILLHNGQRKERLVERFFSRYYNPELGDELATSFKSKYEALEKKGLPPDDIFWELQKFSGGGPNVKPDRQVAVLAVLAYFFNRCDIFKDRSGSKKL